MFGKRLRTARMNSGLTQLKMAESLGIALRTYQHYEEGSRSPSLELLVRIGDILDVSIDYLLCRDDWLKSHGVFFGEHL